MLHRLEQQAPDALLALIKLYAADTRPDKIDLGVGVYRTGQGDTPVFGAIKGAEKWLVENQSSKSYLGPEGDMGFVHALMPYIFGSDATMGGRVEGMQTPGGTGAVRLAIALAKQMGITKLHMGTPSWPNHAQIIKDVALDWQPFDHAKPDGTANLDAVLSAINGAGEGEAVLLHGCCHNPTGIDYSPQDWEAIGDALVASGTFAIIDTAYQGLGDGMDEDLAGMRSVLAKVPEAFICYSCDKNFGMYRDRVGAFYIMADKGPEGADVLAKAFSNANALARASWSMPPDHGAAAVRVILRDPELTSEWLDEVAQMRARMRQVRDYLGNAGMVGRIDFAPMARQNGLFSVLAVSKEEVLALREDHGVYMAGSGRINIAGLTMDNIDKFIAAVADVTG